MVKVIGIRFRTAGKVYYFDPKDIELKRGEHVIVETARGVEFGTVVMPPTDMEDNEDVIQNLLCSYLIYNNKKEAHFLHLL